MISCNIAHNWMRLSETFQGLRVTDPLCFKQCHPVAAVLVT
jgi:hypothetical protein